MNNILENLKEAGLTGNEAKVYYELVKKGELTANQVSKNLGLDRSLSYTILNNLIEKGQVSYIIKDNKKLFSAASPENLLNSIKKKEAKIKDLIPELEKIKVFTESEQEIKIYEGKEGLRNLVTLAFKEKDYCAFGATGWAYSQLYEMPRIVKKIGEKKIRVRLIGSKKLKETEAFKLKNFEYRYLDADSKSPTSVFGEYVSIHLATREKPFIILIKNKDIADTYRNYFEVLWATARK